MAVSLHRVVLAFPSPLPQARKQPDYIQKLQPTDPETRLKHSTTRKLMKPAAAISNESLTSTVTRPQKEESDPRKSRTIADYWRELHGENNWEGLLDPMDPSLRAELIKYGSKVQACYDAFEFDPSSKYFSTSRYSKRELYEALGMVEFGYDITRYLYVTSNIKLPNFFKKTRYPKVWIQDASWMGFVAVSNDETTKKLGRRDVCIVFRGTITRLEWIADLTNILTPIANVKIPCPDSSVSVEAGFASLYTDTKKNCPFCNFSVREQVLAEVYKLVNDQYANEEISITITGHSLGSALAVLSAYDIAESVLSKRKDGSRKIPVTAFTFAGPRVGNNRFKERVERLGVKVLRVVNVHDVVPKSPGLVFNENSNPLLMKFAEHLPWSYAHVGVELALDHKVSPFLRPDGDILCAHNMEGYLHVLNGYHGKGKKFEPATNRDPALVNKSSDFLRDDLEIVANWWQNHNKGMVFRDGRYVQNERIMDDHITDHSCDPMDKIRHQP